MVHLSHDSPSKVALVIAAHPDDPDFGVGGTAALWSREGWEFHYLILTNGSKGTSDRDLSQAELVAMREPEQRAAAEILGVASCTFLGAEDGELEYTREMFGKVVREIRRIRPHAVFTSTPEIVLFPIGGSPDQAVPEHTGFINHRDHRNAGTMAIDAVYPSARDHLNFPEHIRGGLETHNVSELYIFGSNAPNMAIDITDVVDLKVKALKAHVSQFADRDVEFFDWVRNRWVDEDGCYYERFQHVVLPF